MIQSGWKPGRDNAGSTGDDAAKPRREWFWFTFESNSQRPDSFNGPKMSPRCPSGAKELYPMPQKSKHHTKNRLLIRVLKDRFLRWENAIHQIAGGSNKAGSES